MRTQRQVIFLILIAVTDTLLQSDALNSPMGSRMHRYFTRSFFDDFPCQGDTGRIEQNYWSIASSRQVYIFTDFCRDTQMSGKRCYYSSATILKFLLRNSALSYVDVFICLDV